MTFSAISVDDINIPVTVSVTLEDNTLVIWSNHGVDVICVGAGQAGLVLAFGITHIELYVAVPVTLEDDKFVIGGATGARVNSAVVGKIDQVSTGTTFDTVQAEDVQIAGAEGVEDDPLRARWTRQGCAFHQALIAFAELGFTIRTYAKLGVTIGTFTDNRFTIRTFTDNGFTIRTLTFRGGIFANRIYFALSCAAIGVQTTVNRVATSMVTLSTGQLALV